MSSSDSGSAVLAQVRFDIRCVARSSVYIHEDNDPRRSSELRRRVELDKFIANPPIVARVPVDRDVQYVHLDGANRFTVADDLGLRYLPVQVVDLDDPAQVFLGTWSHVVPCEATVLVKSLDRHDEVHVIPFSEAIGKKQCVGGVFGPDVAYGVMADAPDIESRVRAMRAMVALYGSPAARVVTEEEPALSEVQTILKLGNLPTVVTFAPISSKDFETITHLEIKLVGGVSRFELTGGRVLGLDIPLEALRSSAGPMEGEIAITEKMAIPPVIVPGPSQVHEYAGLRPYLEPLAIYRRNVRVRTEDGMRVLEF